MPQLEDVIAGLSQYKDVQGKLDAAKAELEETTRKTTKLLAEADVQARQIVEQAAATSQQSQRTLAEQIKAITQREQDVTAREGATAWITAKEAELATKQAHLNDALKVAEEARVSAKATEQAWQERSKELDGKAAALEARLAKLNDWETRLRQNLPVTELVNS